MSITRGKKLMLFVKDGSDYKSIAFATNHTFSSSVSTVDTSTKDSADIADGSARWQNEELDVFTWSITSEHLYADEGAGMTIKDVMNLYINGTLLELKFGIANPNTAGVPSTGWTEATGLLSGKGYITSCDINASNGDNASASITITGVGPVVLAD